MIRGRFGIAMAVLAATVLGTAVTATVAATAVSPSPWPDTTLARPRIDGYANALRISGSDRYQTGLAVALTLRGQGTFPYGTPDRSSQGANSLGAASQWWGARSCPRSVIIVAGDSPADALAAASLSDPTGNSTEPYLERTAAADPLFDPIGGFARVDTDRAPILVTRSARSGATALSPAARIAAQDLRSGGCTTARQAIVVGGLAAVPTAVDVELLSIGYDEVFRVAGANRYFTAAAISRSLGTAAAGSGVTQCADPLSNDGAVRMEFYANSVVEYRLGADQCQLLQRSVVLTDGITGADALAASWWTGFWQVPLLLHDGSDRLPQATIEALTTMEVDNLIVLGGTARISAAVATQASTIAQATVTRVAGPDRYATSVEMAQRFGGWWPTDTGEEFASSMLCIAASSGSGSQGRGWPDALTSGPLCGGLHGATGDPRPPVRALDPITSDQPRLSSISTANGHDAVPILLVGFGENSLPPVVANFLASAFPTNPVGDPWCASGVADPCRQPGFAVVLGGPAAVSNAAIAQLSRLVSGRSDANALNTAPRLSTAFGTELHLGPVFGVVGSGAGRVCVPRDGYASARWISVFSTTAASRSIAAADVMMSGRYSSDADSTVRSPEVGAPVCVAHDPNLTPSRVTRAVSPTGRVSPVISLLADSSNRLRLSTDLVSSSPNVFSGVDSDLDASDGGVTTRQWLVTTPATVSAGTGDPDVSAVVTSVTGGNLALTLVRGVDQLGVTAPDVVNGSFTLITTGGEITGTITAEAMLISGVWEIRGMTTITSGSFIGARGGFRASLTTNTAGDGSDDAISWRMDAFRAT
jgi:putative cell wall-binding protein